VINILAVIKNACENTYFCVTKEQIKGRDNFNILSETIYLVEIDFLNIVQTIVHRGKNGNLQLIYMQLINCCIFFSGILKICNFLY
jgi:hypothetical protein